MSRSAPVVAHWVSVRVLRSVAALALLLMPVQHHDGDALHHLHAGFQLWSDVFGGLKSQHVGVANTVRTVEGVDTVTNLAELLDSAGTGRDYRPAAIIADLLGLVLPRGHFRTIYNARQWTAWVAIIEPPPRIVSALR